MLSRRHWPYAIEVSDHNRINAERWCYERFKSRNWRNDEYQGNDWFRLDCTFSFKLAQDASIFTLRWT